MRHGLILAGALLLGGCRKELPKLSQLPDFRLTAVDGQTSGPFERKDLPGAPWIASFLFTDCSGPCPMLATQLGKLQADVDQRISLLTFTVDPETDTPKVLAAYARKVGARPTRWRFVTGEPAVLAKLFADGFKVAAVKDPTAPAGIRIAHSTKLVLVDRDGFVRGYYDSEDAASLIALKRDALSLTRP